MHKNEIFKNVLLLNRNAQGFDVIIIIIYGIA